MYLVIGNYGEANAKVLNRDSSGSILGLWLDGYTRYGEFGGWKTLTLIHVSEDGTETIKRNLVNPYTS